MSRRGSDVEGRRAAANFDAEAGRALIARVLAEADTIWPGHDCPFAVVGGEAGEYIEEPNRVTVTDHSGLEPRETTF